MAGNVTADLIRALIDTLGDPGVDASDWQSLAIMLEFPNGRFSAAHGYLYSADGEVVPVASRPSAVRRR